MDFAPPELIFAAKKMDFTALGVLSSLLKATFIYDTINYHDFIGKN